MLLFTTEKLRKKILRFLIQYIFGPFLRSKSVKLLAGQNILI